MSSIPNFYILIVDDEPQIANMVAQHIRVALRDTGVKPEFTLADNAQVAEIILEGELQIHAAIFDNEIPSAPNEAKEAGAGARLAKLASEKQPGIATVSFSGWQGDREARNLRSLVDYSQTGDGENWHSNQRQHSRHLMDGIEESMKRLLTFGYSITKGDSNPEMYDQMRALFRDLALAHKKRHETPDAAPAKTGAEDDKPGHLVGKVIPRDHLKGRDGTIGAASDANGQGRRGRAGGGG